MSERTLQHVLSVLRERLPAKLSAQAQSNGSGNAAAAVDVYRGHGFQFAWYLKKLEKRHAILLKNREMVFQGGGGGGSGERERDGGGDEEESKPRKRLNYTGFSIYGHQLVIIVEPYPAIPKTSRSALDLDPPKEQGQLVKEAEKDMSKTTTDDSSSSRQALSIEDFLKANAAQGRTGRNVNKTKGGEREAPAAEADETIDPDEEAKRSSRGLLDEQMGLGSFEDQSEQV